MTGSSHFTDLRFEPVAVGVNAGPGPMERWCRSFPHTVLYFQHFGHGASSSMHHRGRRCVRRPRSGTENHDHARDSAISMRPCPMPRRRAVPNVSSRFTHTEAISVRWMRQAACTVNAGLPQDCHRATWGFCSTLGETAFTLRRFSTTDIGF